MSETKLHDWSSKNEQNRAHTEAVSYLSLNRKRHDKNFNCVKFQKYI